MVKPVPLAGGISYFPRHWHTEMAQFGAVTVFGSKSVALFFKKVKGYSLLAVALNSDGAEGESRTPTGEPPLDPEPSVSTNSTTSA